MSRDDQIRSGRDFDAHDDDDFEPLSADLDDDDDDLEPLMVDLDDDDDDFVEDATSEEIDFTVALYREDGVPQAVPLDYEVANDLEELIAQLRRLPGDAGAIGVVSIAQEMLVVCRVRGRNVQVVCNDSLAANDWPIALDVLDYLRLELPDDDEDSAPVGDFSMLADQGVSSFDLENKLGDLDEDSDVLAEDLATQMGFGKVFATAAAEFDA